ncbi:MAG: HDOD domain-containing protein [Myxococcales bacterium]|nr:HDOD domain-containing protein [Myxococcales bacterium]
MSEKLEQYLESTADDLPAMPAIAREIIRAVDDPSSCIADIKELIEQDSAIAAKLLKMSNSALYGFPSEINSISHAISLLGTRTVRNLVLAVSLKKTFRRFGLMEQLLWQHSTLSGPVAAKLSALPQIDVSSDEAFTAGLLHHIGKTALANSHHDEYEQVIQRVYNEKIGFVQAETEQFGFDHSILGGAIASRWNLPDSLVSVIENHHNSGALASLPEGVARLTALISVTSICLTKLGVGRAESVDEIEPANLPAWNYLDLTEDDVEHILEICTDQIKTSQELIS